MQTPTAVDSPPTATDDQAVNSMAAQNPDEELHSMAAVISNQPLREDFNDNALGWLVSASPISRQVADGAYQVLVEVPDRAISAYPEQGYQYDDFIYQAEATLVEGQPESGYGLIFRRQDNQNYYVFAINGLGQWSIWRLEDGVWRELRNLPDGQTWSPAEAILPQGETNILMVEANGPDLRLFVNDQALVAQPVVDATFARGGIGLYVASSRTSADAFAQVQFDKVSVTPFAAMDGVPSMTVDE